MNDKDRQTLPPEMWALGNWIEAKFDHAMGEVRSIARAFEYARVDEQKYRDRMDERMKIIEEAALKAAGAYSFKRRVALGVVSFATILGGIAGFASLFLAYG